MSYVTRIFAVRRCRPFIIRTIPTIFTLLMVIAGCAQVRVQTGYTAFHERDAAPGRQDTLRGAVTPERAWWDLQYYHLEVKVDIDRRFISGTNLVQYTVLEPARTMQIDLQPPMEITAVMQDGAPLEFTREGNAFFIHMQKKQRPGRTNALRISFEGNPKVAKRAPWDGGFSWDTGPDDKPFVATSCQGLGASVWWPCKDHMYDEPDSMKLSFNVPSTLTAVGNGRLTETETFPDGTTTYHWMVRNPISNYVVNLNIGNYAHFSEVFNGENGPLQCDYYVLKANLDRAKAHFAQVPGMLAAFEHWFGPYPFYEDSYKLVEVPYLGMEHQSSVTYGNHYQQGYSGRDLSGTGWGLLFDFIIIHESGHEWFANSITYRDIADMWIHESFINYSEGLYVEYHYGKEAGNEYLRGIRRNILNDIPVIGIYDVNREGSGDMYAKGASMLHTIRQLVGDDEKWRGMLRGLNAEFYHSTVTTEQIENYMIEYTGLDLQPVFDQYLRTVNIPTLEYYFSAEHLVYRWINVVADFAMPVKVRINGTETWLEPGTSWKRMETGAPGIPSGEASDDSASASAASLPAASASAASVDPSSTASAYASAPASASATAADQATSAPAPASAADDPRGEHVPPDHAFTLSVDPDFFVGSMNMMGE